MIKFLFVSMLLIYSIGCFTFQADSKEYDCVKEKTQAIEALNRQTNRLRTQTDLQPWRMSATLTQIAQLQSDRMASLKRITHFDENNRGPLERLAFLGLQPNFVGQNVSRTLSDSNSVPVVLKSWMEGSEEKRNLFRPEHKKIGIGLSTDGDYCYWTLLLTD